MSIAAFTSTAKLEVETVLGVDRGYVVVSPCLPIVVAPVSSIQPLFICLVFFLCILHPDKNSVIARVKTEALI